MKKHLVLIKMGGSLITDKAKPLTFRKRPVQRLAQEIRALKSDDIDFVLATGAGSFAHFTAHQYGLRSGAHTPEQFYGTCVAHNATQRLSGLVADEFTKIQTPVFTVSPSAMMMCHDSEVQDSTIAPLRGLLANRIIPIVHGDTILDSVRGATIVSSEKILHVLMKQLKPDYQRVSVIYLMDTDGILDKHGNLLSTFADADELHIHASHNHDVTGGIVGKLQSARQALEHADTVHLANGMKPGVIGEILAGSPIGTQIIP